MALAVTALDSGSSNVDATSIDTVNTITPTAGALQLLAVARRPAAGGVPALTITGCGVTWVAVRTGSFVTVYRALGTPTAGTLHFDAGASTCIAWVWAWIEVTGVDPSGTNGSGAIVQSNATTGGGSAGSIATTLAARSNAANFLYEASGIRNNTAITNPASWTEVHDLGNAGDTQRLETAHYNADDLAPAVTFSTSANREIIALEIKAAQIVTLTPATETDAAVGLDLDKQFVLSPATETDAGVALDVDKAVTLTPATESDTAQALDLDKHVTLTPATELDAAEALVVATPPPPPRPTLAALLDMEDRSRRAEGPVFEVLDSSLRRRGILAVSGSAVPRVRNDATGLMPRTVDGLRIPPRTALTAEDPRLFAEDVDTLSDRIRLVWTVGAGEDQPRYEVPWGVFLFADENDPISTAGSVLECRLVDQTQITGQLLADSVGFPIGANVGDCLTVVAALFGLVNVSIEATGATLSAPISALSGRDTGDKLATDLCRAAGFLRPYFNNDGAWVCRSAPDPANLTIDHVYGAGGRVDLDSPVLSNGLLHAPNLYLVRDTSASESGIVGRYEVPASAPHSRARIGYWRPGGQDVQGLADQVLADLTAQALYAEDPTVFSSLTFTTPIDPRHDTFDVLTFDGDPYIEQEWDAELVEGGTMSHDGRRVFQDA